MLKAATAGTVGALLEWYDFYIFATASALVFGQLFFPGTDKLAGTMASFGVFAAGFVSRPIGGILFGHIGDTGIKQGAPAPQEFPMPVFRPPPGTSAPPQR